MVEYGNSLCVSKHGMHCYLVANNMKNLSYALAVHSSI